MSNPGAFVLPAGVRLSFDDGALSIHNEGDIVIEGAPSQRLGTLRSESGSVRLSSAANLALQAIEAPAGDVQLDGKFSLGSIRAKNIDFANGALKVTVLKAGEAVRLAGERVEADVVVAQRVDIAASAKGRATAIQSVEEVGPHKLKGGFSLSEFVGLVPNGADILQAHGIDVPASEDGDEPSDEEPEPAAERSRSSPPRAERPPPPRPAAAPPPPPADSPVLEPFEPSIPSIPSINFEPEPPTPLAPAQVPAEVRSAVADAVDKIVLSYRNRETPPPVLLMKRMVDADEWKSLKLQINTIWSDLLKYHQQTDPFISNTVSIMFQTVQMQLRKVQI